MAEMLHHNRIGKKSQQRNDLTVERRFSDRGQIISACLFTAINTDSSLKDILKAIVRSIIVAVKARASILTFDPKNKSLVHRSTLGLTHAYLHNWLLSADASLGEVNTTEPVVIIDASQDKRVQYPKRAIEADIKPIAGVPIKLRGVLLGSLIS